MSSFNSTDIFCCAQCGRDFKKKNHLSIHMNVHYPNAVRISCKICPYKAKTAPHFKRHMLTKHAVKYTKVYRCALCKYNNKQRFVLVEHLRSHYGKRFLICPVCSKKFYSALYLNKHHTVAHSKNTPTEDTTLEEKSYVCAVCMSRVKSKRTLCLHFRRYHSCNRTKCRYCHIPFESEKFLFKHLNKIHFLKWKERKLTCAICESFYTCSKGQLALHITKHYGCNGTFLCKFCNKWLSSKYTLNHHRCRHFTGDIPKFKCSKCLFIYEGKWRRKRHSDSLMCSLLHKAILKLPAGVIYLQGGKCPFCINRPPDDTVGKFYVHMTSHVEVEKVFRCNFCSESFITPARLSNHILYKHEKNLRL